MVYEKEFSQHGFNNIVAYSGVDISDQMMEESFKVSESFFEDEYQIKDSKIRDLIKKTGQICFVIYDKAEKKVIGYSFWLPIKSQVFANFLQNKEMLMFIEEEHCSKFDEPVVNLFQAGEGFVPGYDLDNLHRAVEDIIQNKILQLAKRGVLVEYLAIEAVCKYDKEYLAPLMGLTKNVNKGNSVFYLGKYSPKTFFARSNLSDELKNYYKN